MYWRVEVKDKEGMYNAAPLAVKAALEQAGCAGLRDVRCHHVTYLIGSAQRAEAERAAAELLTDPVTQTYDLRPGTEALEAPAGYLSLQVLHRPGVMDPAEESTLKGLHDMGISSVEGVRTAQRYLFKGTVARATLLRAAEKVLYNKLIQYVLAEDDHRLLDFAHLPDYVFSLKTVPLRAAADKQLLRLSREGQLYLNLEEMRVIRDFFRGQKREPTDCELETIAQTWSEHCVHKTFRGNVAYKESLGGASGAPRKVKRIGGRTVKNLLKQTVMRATRELDKKTCVSVFKDNSGIVAFDGEYNICFKVETHNHPSALEPYGGANTGIGGVIRDPLGTGLGAKPILNTDVFCFGPLAFPQEKLPPGTLPPRRVMKGVVSGVRDYGNRMGIPTANGAVLFDERFVGNPLVYCGTLGILPKGASFKEVRAGDVVVVVGGRTGRDGIHGATFSSGELTHESESVSSGAVQIGNAITEKKALDVLLKARDAGLYRAITDCGAGGLSSAVGEMGAETGARVDLEKVPLKYHGLTYTEIWISEAQERMVLAVDPGRVAALLEAFAKEDVEATAIGVFGTPDRHLKLFYEGHPVCDLDMHFLHEGLPRITKKAVWVRPRHAEKRVKPKKDLTPALLGLLAHPNIASKEWVIRQYDHEVQGATVIKPLVGVDGDGPSDACVIKPRFDSLRGVAVANGINFRYGDLDPYWMAVLCVDEALRQLTCVGAPLGRAALLDNFCWGNPDKPDRLGALVRAAYGCYDAAKGFGVPFISGKDSFYNEFAAGKKTVSIPSTLLISALSVMEDVTKAVTMDVKRPENLLYAVGTTYAELGGSHYYDLLKIKGGRVPVVDLKAAKAAMGRLAAAVERGLVASLHDCSEGGLGVAAAEMAFAGGFGVNLFLGDVPFSGRERREDILLFAESASRFLAEVDPARKKDFERAMKGSACALIGCVAARPEMTAFGLKGQVCLRAPLALLKETWQAPLRSL
ncbi:MAG: phosphoribosylformylglycinamidine synthase subunit PurL [Deltaproteobacteria bacterium]